ncbi:hypothetical protein AL480_02215 [Stenotrophomonas maltophilia]|jgi:hypothetical protein|uniref:hypothetical protein n=1 Tax=Stenotrophomonas maltophilia TaxID=40324 RepID=UPI000CF338B6|nr:hypothetical protein [Stenotrophomonas maltophilia]AVH89713.1 hypothetical protein AL480_02215 [Stenotrophomonas maltophilia]MBA0237281.1 hypothetical protein [Stenotrophomonas maltophilia]MBN5036302.1 hypothetical protein [Stenotrophomonas maltophilia]
MNINNTNFHRFPDVAPEHLSSFALVGGYVDRQVLAGRSLDNVLQELDNSSPGQKIWHNTEMLQNFSVAVAARLNS